MDPLFEVRHEADQPQTKSSSATPLNSRNQKNFGFWVEFSDQDIAFVGDVGGEPTLSDLVVEFLLDLREAISGYAFRIPFGQRPVSASANHPKLSARHVSS